jgi:hypothetical protein
VVAGSRIARSKNAPKLSVAFRLRDRSQSADDLRSSINWHYCRHWYGLTYMLTFPVCLRTPSRQLSPPSLVVLKTDSLPSDEEFKACNPKLVSVFLYAHACLCMQRVAELSRRNDGVKG